MKTINVVAAIIENKEDKIFAAKRGYGDFGGKWEFPGGKIEPGEAPEDALKREIREELEVNIDVGELMIKIEYDYPNFHLSMRCYFAEIKSGSPTLVEHKDAGWFEVEELPDLEWLPANRQIIMSLSERFENDNK